MPGIDKSKFLNFVDNEDEWLCGICLAVFVNPLVTQCCQQTYCDDCIKKWVTKQKTCPNCREKITYKKLSPTPRIVKNLLNKFKLICDYNENGCKEELCYYRYIKHIESCQFNPDGICSHCRERNGKRSEHNCIEILLAKYPILQCFNTKIKNLNDLVKILTYQNELFKNKTLLDFLNKIQSKWNRIEQKVSLQDLRAQVMTNNMLSTGMEAIVLIHAGYDYLSFLHLCFSKDYDWIFEDNVKMINIKITDENQHSVIKSLISSVFSYKVNKCSSFENERNRICYNS